MEDTAPSPSRILACRLHEDSKLPNHIWSVNTTQLIVGDGVGKHRVTMETSTIGEFMDDYGLSFEDVGATPGMADVPSWHYASGDKKSWVLWV